MNIVIDSKDLKNLKMFSSCILFKNNNGMLDMAATNGESMLVIRRKLQVEEVLNKQVCLRLPQVSGNGSYTIVKENEKHIVKELGSACQSMMVAFPSYERGLGLWGKYTNTGRFALFSSEQMKMLESVTEGKYELPLGSQHGGFYLWTYQEGDKVYLIALMAQRY